MSYRIAIASHSGQKVDVHFGQAENFLIYEIGDDGISFIEDREVIRNDEEKPHSDENLRTIVELLNDCSAVFIVKIGMRSSRYLYENGIKTFQLDMPLNDIFTRLLNNYRTGRVKVL